MFAVKIDKPIYPITVKHFNRKVLIFIPCKLPEFAKLSSRVTCLLSMTTIKGEFYDLCRHTRERERESIDKQTK